MKEEKRTNAKTGWTLDTRAIYQSTGKLKLTSGAEIHHSDRNDCPNKQMEMNLTKLVRTVEYSDQFQNAPLNIPIPTIWKLVSKVSVGQKSHKYLSIGIC